jgi:clan AA aspartic protease
MTNGRFRDGHPRITISLPGVSGQIAVEFIVDTGFDGEISIPPNMMNQLAVENPAMIMRRLAGDMRVRVNTIDLEVPVDDGNRTVEALVMPGEPLVGMQFLADHEIHIQVFDGGDVIVESL